MPDPGPGRGGAAWFADEIRRIDKAIRDVGIPSGTQQFNAVPKLQEQIAQLATAQQQLADLVGNIEQTLTDFIQNDVAAIVDDAITARLAAPFITIGVAGGSVRIPSLYTTDVTLSNKPRNAVWVDSDGLVGHT